jgi:hypothetical protein
MCCSDLGKHVLHFRLLAPSHESFPPCFPPPMSRVPPPLYTTLWPSHLSSASAKVALQGDRPEEDTLTSFRCCYIYTQMLDM